MSDGQNKLIVFQGDKIRRTRHNDEWWYSVIDMVEALSVSKRPRKYWSDLKRKLADEGFNELSDKIGQLKLEAPDGKMRKTDCANTETMFRILQSIPSLKAEPFKRWFAKVAYERVQEIENPELTAERARQSYKDLGYSDEWIATRLKSIEVRGQLTDEWKERDVEEGLEFAILTADMIKATFGVKPSDYKKYKGLDRENLRDHQNPIELIFTMLSEATAKKETIKADAKGFHQNRKAAIKGGASAGDALKAYEKSTGEKVKSPENFKNQIKAAKEQKKLEKKAAREQKKLEQKAAKKKNKPKK